MAGSLNITLLKTNLLTQLILIGLKCDDDNDDDNMMMSLQEPQDLFV